MITTNDNVLATKIRKIINHGSEKRYYHDFIGHNFRLTDIAAAIGIEQLKKLPAFTKLRQENARYLSSQISAIAGLKIPVMDAGHVFHQYTILVTSQFPVGRDQLLQHLTQRGIGTAVFYPLPIHQQKAYPEFHHQHFPVTETVAQQVLSLPVHPQLTASDLATIIEAISHAQ